MSQHISTRCPQFNRFARGRKSSKRRPPICPHFRRTCPHPLSTGICNPLFPPTPPRINPQSGGNLGGSALFRGAQHDGGLGQKREGWGGGGMAVSRGGYKHPM